jgi:tetratricopeptide (TPR) repeat protein
MRIVLIVFLVAAAAYAGDAAKAESLLKAGKAAEARKAAEGLVESDGKNAAAWLVLADALVALQEPEEAWTRLETAIGANPGSAALRLKLGDIFLKLAEKEMVTSKDGTTITNYLLDSRRVYEEACAIEKSADGLYGRAYVTYQLARDDYVADTRKLLSEALALNGKHGPALGFQGDLFYYEAGDTTLDKAKRIEKYAAAVNQYEIAAKLHDPEALLFVRWGHACVFLGKPDDAKKAYIESVKRHPRDEAGIRSGLYYLARQAKDYWPAAIALLEETAQVAPKSSVTWFHLGYAYAQVKRFDDALKAYGQASAIDPKNAVYWYCIGSIDSSPVCAPRRSARCARHGRGPSRTWCPPGSSRAPPPSPARTRRARAPRRGTVPSRRHSSTPRARSRRA